MAYGWTGTILRVDLTKGKVVKTPSAPYNKAFIGGEGVNVRLLYEESRPGQSPLDPEAPLIFGWGPIVGTGIIGGNRTETTHRTFPSGFYGDASFGGYFGVEAKFAGYDNLVIKGRAEKPVYLHIENENVTIMDASGLWGRDTFETPTMIREELGDPKVEVACIGLAGENLVAFATIEHKYRAAAGKGAGAIMGSKNLKAIAVRGTKPVNVFDPEKILELNEEIYREIERTEDLAKISSMETKGEDISSFINRLSLKGGIGNFEGFEGMSWSDFEKTKRETFIDKYVAGAEGKYGCFGCPLQCYSYVNVPGVGAMAMTCMSWYIYRMWSTDMELLSRADMLMSRYGIDHQAMMGAISWLMQLYRLGIITAKDTDGIPFGRGSEEAIMAAIEKLARREGFGDVFADGPLALAKKIGRNAEYYLIHQWGLIPSASYDWRVTVFRSLACAVSTRGDTIKGASGPGVGASKYWKAFLSDNPEDLKKIYALAKEMYGTEKAVIPWEYEGKAKVVMLTEIPHVYIDLLGFCRRVRRRIKEYDGFAGDSYSPKATAMLANIFSAATGVDMDASGLLMLGEKVNNLERAFNLREGHRGRVDDSVPERFFKESIPDGPHKGRVLNRKKFEKMKGEYYTLRGWDVKTGLPMKAKLIELGLKDVADDLEKLGKLSKPKKA